ncbi:MAG: leucine-rich repeat protein [Clostridia bacterium]|nr:leucine-rich repeat protein [Clostridia bacterium]
MKTTKLQKIISTVLAVLIMVSAVPLTAITASAATEGTYLGFEYMIDGGEVSITGYTGSATDLTVPQKISGYPVVTVLGGTFRDNTAIKNVVIPDGVTQVGSSAFYGCTSLESVTLPEGIDTIFASTFYNCKSLRSVNIPTTVTKINTNSFNGCASLESIEIPEGVTKIAPYAFYGCKSLTGITFPEGLESIGDYAFEGCAALERATIPAGVTTMGECAFLYCDRLTIYGYKGTAAERFANSCEIPFVALDGSSVPEGLEYSIYDGEIIIKGYTGSAAELDIPAEIDGCPVTRIGGYAFNGNAALTSITLPDTIRFIGDWAFAGTGITSIYIPDSVTEFETCVFMDCDKLSYVRLPEGITCISGYMFSGCYNLKEIVIPDSVIIISSGAFNGCGLSSIDLPDGIERIDYYSFYYCKDLESVVIPDGVTFIDDYAFGYCESLVSVTIPESVTEIMEYAFDYCPNLTIYGYKGSEAERYANEHNVPFVLLHELSADNIIYRGESEVILEAGESYTPEFGLDPADATDDIVLTADSDCVRIEDGTVIAVSTGSATVTATATSGVSCSFNVTVRSVTDVQLISAPYKREYTSDESLDLRGIEIEVRYSDGTVDVYDSSSITNEKFSVYYEGITGNQPVYVEYKAADGNNYSVYFTISLKVIDGIYVESLPYKTEYNMGESFDAAGLLVSLRYTDGTSMAVTDYKLEGFDSSKQGICNVQIIWADDIDDEHYTSFEVKIIDPNSIPIEGMILADGKDLITLFPDDMFYSYYADFEVYPPDATDSITLYTDSDCISIDGMTIRPCYSGMATVTAVADSGVEYIFTVEVCDFREICIEQYPYKTVYNIGEEFDPEGIKLAAVFHNGQTVDVNDLPNCYIDYCCFDSSFEGISYVQAVVTISTGQEFYIEIPVEIVDPTPRAHYIEIASYPYKTVYDRSDPAGLDLSGLVVNAYYADGSVREITDYWVEYYDLNMEGMQHVNIGWNSERGEYFSTYFDIYVRDVYGIEIISLPNKTVYDLYEPFDPSGMIVRINYSNGDREETTNFETGYFENSFEGIHRLEITWINPNTGMLHFTSFEYEVRDSRPLATEIYVQSEPLKTIYDINDPFDPMGLRVYARYADGTERELDDYYVIGFSSSYEGYVPVGVEWTNERGEYMTTYFYIYVRDVSGITVQTAPYKSEYELGESLDISGLEVVVNYTDGSTEYITDYIVSGFESHMAGMLAVTVSWCAPSGQWYYAYFDVNIVDTAPVPLEIYIATLPDKLEYLTRESLDLTGMTVYMVYSDGTESLITDYKVSGYNALKEGVQTVTVTSFEGFTATFDVTVKKPATVTGIAIEALPEKLTYYIGEKLDLTGLSVVAVMSDGTYEPITVGYTVSGFTSNSVGTVTVTVSYNGYTASFELSVVKYYMIGDVNGDANLNALDSFMLAMIVCQAEFPSEDQLVTADINGDGKINAIDSNLMRRVIAGSYII